MKKHISLILLMVAALSVAACDKQETKDTKEKPGSGIATVSPKAHEAIKATVVNDSPGSFTIDVEKMANLGADQEAPTFAIYMTDSLPKTCGDFRELELPYKKPEKYIRKFDLSDHKDVLAAIDKYGCVVMKNVPPAK